MPQHIVFHVSRTIRERREILLTVSDSDLATMTHDELAERAAALAYAPEALFRIVEEPTTDYRADIMRRIRPEA